MAGLTFLNQLFLWALAAAAIPVIVHLLKRNRAVKLQFAAMRFLPPDPNKKLKSQTLKQWLLLLLRIVALAVLALAFARPFIEHQETAAFWRGDQPTAAAILIDNSYSMGANGNLLAALDKSNELLAAFRPGDQVSVVQFGETSKVVDSAEADFSAMSSRIADRIAVSREATDFVQALRTAENILLESPIPQKRIYVISDFQITGWRNVGLGWNVRPGIRVEFFQVGHPEQFNLAIDDVHIERGNTQRRRADFRARVRNYSGKTLRTTVALTVNGRRQSQRRVKLKANGDEIVTFPRISLPRGYVRGAVSLQGAADVIDCDNSYYFVLHNDDKSEILAVNGEPRGNSDRDELFFLDRALNLPGLGRYSLSKIAAAGLDGQDLHAYRAVVLANVKDLSRAQIERLYYYVSGGGGLFIALGDQIVPKIFNSLFQRLSPARLNNRAFAEIDHKNGVVLSAIDFQHAVFRPFAEPGQGDPSSARFFQYFHMSPNKPEFVLAAFDDGSPAVLERKVGAGKVLLLASSLDTEWNNLPIKAIYLPLLYQMMDYIAAVPKGQESFTVGAPVSLARYRVGPQSQTTLAVETPAAEKIAPQGSYFENTGEPGIYRVYTGNRRKPAAYFAVNVNTSESDLAAAPREDLGAREAQIARGEASAAALLTGEFDAHQEQAQKLWRLALLMVILLLVGETWLANRTYR